MCDENKVETSCVLGSRYFLTSLQGEVDVVWRRRDSFPLATVPKRQEKPTRLIQDRHNSGSKPEKPKVTGTNREIFLMWMCVE